MKIEKIKRIFKQKFTCAKFAANYGKPTIVFDYWPKPNNGHFWPNWPQRFENFQRFSNRPSISNRNSPQFCELRTNFLKNPPKIIDREPRLSQNDPLPIQMPFFFNSFFLKFPSKFFEINSLWSNTMYSLWFFFFIPLDSPDFKIFSLIPGNFRFIKVQKWSHDKKIMQVIYC